MMGSTCSTDATIMSESTITTSATTIKPFSQLSESYSREQSMFGVEIEESKPEQHFTYIGSREKLPEKSDDVIRDLEQRQYSVVNDFLKSSDPADKLISFMKNGTDEFMERTGRTMTYAEMRAAWG